MAEWPLFPVTVVGSWPRPRDLLRAMKRGAPDLPALQERATLEAIRAMEGAGVDIVSDGEQRRDSFVSFVADRIDGLACMTMADMLEHVEDKAAFETILSALDVPAFAIRNPVVTGPLSIASPLALDDYRFLRANTDRAIKVALPGPYLLARASWVKKLSADAYPTREALADDFVRLLREEIIALAEAGCEVIQLDEPVLTELVFAGKSNTHTFMCSALAASASPEEELDFAVELINRVVDGIDGPVIALHVCRGNWSRKEEVLLSGDYDDLVPYLARIRVDQFVLEYATPRAGSVDVLRGLPDGAMLGFGVVNPRTAEIESPEWIVGRVREALAVFPPERIFLNPDCGFGTFAERPMATPEIAVRKLEALAEAAAILRRG